MKTFILGLAVAVLTIGLLAGAYFFGKNQNKQTSSSSSPTPTQAVKQDPTETLNETSPTLTPKNSRAWVSENIQASINTKNYQALEGYIKDSVVLTLYATECCGTITQEKATAQMDYLSSSKGSWDFLQNNSVRLKLIQSSPENFSDDMIIGISSDKYVAGFKLNSQNEIEKIILVSDYNLIVP